MKHKLLWALGGTVGFTLFPKIVALVSNSLHVGLIPKLIVDLQQLSQEVKPTYLYSTMASDGSPSGYPLELWAMGHSVFSRTSEARLWLAIAIFDQL